MNDPVDYAAISMLVLDVDGVLTDGGLYVDEDGRTWKRFSVVDGAGIVYWRRVGLDVAIISGHASKAVEARCRSLGLPEDRVVTGAQDKLQAYLDLLARAGLSPAQSAAVGDDLMDLPILRRCAFPATVKTAHPEVRAVARYVAEAAAGRGAVREIVEHLLKTKGLYDRATERYRA